MLYKANSTGRSRKKDDDVNLCSCYEYIATFFNEKINIKGMNSIDKRKNRGDYMKKTITVLLLCGMVVLGVVLMLMNANPKEQKVFDAYLNDPYAFVTTQGTTMTVLFTQIEGERITGKIDMYDTIFHRDGTHEVEHIEYKMSGNTLHQKPQHFTMYLENKDDTIRLEGQWSKDELYVIEHPKAKEANFEPVTKEEYKAFTEAYHQAMDDMIVEWED